MSIPLHIHVAYHPKRIVSERLSSSAACQENNFARLRPVAIAALPRWGKRATFCEHWGNTCFSKCSQKIAAAVL